MKAMMNNVISSNKLFHSVGSSLSYLNRFSKKITSKREQPSHNDEFSNMLCPTTGALNRIGLRKCFDQIAPSDLTQMSIIYFQLNELVGTTKAASQKQVDKTKQQFVVDLLNICSDKDLIARWGENEFVVACPDFSSKEADKLAQKASLQVNNKTWQLGQFYNCRVNASQVSQEELHQLISYLRARVK